ncbi:MAG: hypothetical protein IJA04_06755 [Bacteroidaceae bacterium]|nr:hypothetical protein [Bacteroidaceae bacterium]
MFRRRKACASEYKASLLAVVNERSQGSLKAVQSYGTAFSSLFNEGQLYCFAQKSLFATIPTLQTFSN